LVRVAQSVGDGEQGILGYQASDHDGGLERSIAQVDRSTGAAQRHRDEVITVIKAINHVGISVANFDRALQFYRDVIGMETVVDKSFSGEMYEAILGLKGARGRVAALRLGEQYIELFEFLQPQPKTAPSDRAVCDHGITHFCLGVEDIYGEYERLKAAGVVFHCPPQHSGKAIATYGRDPEGNVFELLTLL
jgi:catechol 2,3-dioxygenase-like lactoylglutathione lyase family enzyme